MLDLRRMTTYFEIRLRSSACFFYSLPSNYMGSEAVSLDSSYQTVDTMTVAAFYIWSDSYIKKIHSWLVMKTAGSLSVLTNYSAILRTDTLQKWISWKYRIGYPVQGCWNIFCMLRCYSHKYRLHADNPFTLFFNFRLFCKSNCG